MPLRVLHLSDLHRDDGSEQLEVLWQSAERAIKESTELALQGDQFDFLVLSGDLSARAEESEYTEILDLIDYIAKRSLPDGASRSRVIVVPGNHDVDWNHDCYSAWQVDGEKPDKVAEAIRRFGASPHSAEHRLTIGRYGHLNRARVDRGSYAKRFARFQDFVDKLYKDEPQREEFKKFDLVSGSDHGAWSAHVFPEQRIAFYGFNSCVGNDKYWHGAHIPLSTINSAAEHARKHARGCTLVAVWHHGFESHPTRPDRLSLGTLEQLRRAAFSIGMHGHVHDNSVSLPNLVSGNFLLISTGTFAASQQERPEATPRLFTVLEINDVRARVSAYKLDKDHLSMPHGATRTVSLRRVPTKVGPHAQMHRRTAQLSENAVAKVAVELVGVETTHDEIPLACPQQCAGSVEVKSCYVDGRSVRPEESFDPPWFSLAAGKYTNVSFAYELSTFAAVSKEDLEVVGRGPEDSGYVAPGSAAWTHVVSMDSDQLVLSLELPWVAEVGSVKLIVESHHYLRRRVEWRRTAPEADRCTMSMAVLGNGRSNFSLRVEDPLVGNRYGFEYTLPSRGVSTVGPAMDLRELRNFLLDTQRNADLSEELYAALEVAMDVDGTGTWAPASMRGYLWDADTAMLRYSFGRYDDQGTTLRAGEDLAGYAFRFGLVSASHSQARISTRSILRSATAKRRWEFAIPIVSDHFVGVIHIAHDTSDGDPTAMALDDLALRTARPSVAPGVVEKPTDRISLLFASINVAFWKYFSELADHDGPPVAQKRAHDYAHFKASDWAKVLESRMPLVPTAGS
ncbi:MAG: hypothetical protein RLZZ450_5730 [Pseudomonadota bacterium]|jgi:DNA repair exonuclease SbcCD nuclease subunit